MLGIDNKSGPVSRPSNWTALTGNLTQKKSISADGLAYSSVRLVDRACWGRKQMGRRVPASCFDRRFGLSAGVDSYVCRGQRALVASVLFLCLLAAAARADPDPNIQEVKEPEIVSRAAWGALPAKTELLHEQKPAEIILHHTGSVQQPKVPLEAKLRGLQGFGMSPGRVGLLSKPAWGDIPYHFYVDASGRIGEGRDLSYAGDAVTNFDNDDRIQIVVEGDFEREQPTKAQIESLTKLVTWLAAKYGIPAEYISGHGDHDQTDCPGRNLKAYLSDLRKAVEAETATGDK
jgi:hypothetical protein